MAILYISAGVLHFVFPQQYIRIMPSWIPLHAPLVLISGCLEILLGLLLCWPSSRRFAAWGIIIFLVAVFPANVEMMCQYKTTGHPFLWAAILRLPLQILLAWWAWQYTKPVSA